MPEAFFRYVRLVRVQAYEDLGWRTIGFTCSPHIDDDYRLVAIMEWSDGQPVEPSVPENIGHSQNPEGA